MLRFSIFPVLVLLGTLATGCAVSHLTADLDVGQSQNGGGASGATGGVTSTAGFGNVGGTAHTGGSNNRGTTWSSAGTANSIGGTGTGGLLTTGGVRPSGGTAAIVSSTKSSGGTAGTGGDFVIDTPTGGVAATGGAATGGMKAVSGGAATGGTEATGGTKATGGIASTGGVMATGSTIETGGTPATGGSSATECVIGTSHYVNRAVNPSNVCQRCDLSLSTTTWSANDGAACNDGLFCNGADTCGNGTCSVHAGDPCNDKVQCNGTEPCDETSNQCSPGTATCSGSEICDVSKDSCVSSCSGCNIAGSCYAQGATRQGTVCQHCDTAVSATSWTNDDGVSCGTSGQNCSGGVCACPTGWTGSNCSSCVAYVKGTGGSDTNSGQSWAQARATVQAGLDAALARLSADGVPSCELWVAAGTYVPGAPGSARTVTFQLRSGVQLYGGFVGGEAERDQRDWKNVVTVLSGDIAGDDNPNDSTTLKENARHVVTGADNAVLDGFTISGGNANASSSDSGGGVYNSSTSPTISNCTFTGNTASSSGGAVYNNASSPTISNCAFTSNSANSGGAIINGAKSAATISELHIFEQLRTLRRRNRQQRVSCGHFELHVLW